MMIKNLKKQLNELNSFIEHGDVVNERISKKGTYWHLDHTIQVINAISDALKNSDPTDYKSKFSIPKFIIMNTGFIPRGKGHAPKQSLPQNKITKEELLSNLEKAQQTVEQLPQIPKEKIFKHPFFGYLKSKDTVKFIDIHTHHHIKIMRGLVK